MKHIPKLKNELTAAYLNKILKTNNNKHIEIDENSFHFHVNTKIDIDDSIMKDSNFQHLLLVSKDHDIKQIEPRVRRNGENNQDFFTVRNSITHYICNNSLAEVPILIALVTQKKPNIRLLFDVYELHQQDINEFDILLS